MRLGEKLRKVRLKRKMTQRELAGKDFTAPFISQVEKGLTVPSLKALIILANRLGYPPGYFIQTKADTDRERFQILLNLGNAAMVLGDEEAALGYFQQALKVATDLGDLQRQADARHHLAVVHMRGQRFEEARRELQAALAEFEKLGDLPGLAAVHFQLGLLHQHFRNPRGAAQAYQRALEAMVSETTADSVLEIKLRANLGTAYLSLGEREQGVALMREAAARADEVADPATLGATCMRRAHELLETGDLEQALAESGRAWQVLQALDMARIAARVQANMGVVASEQDRWEEAGEHFSRSLELHRRVGDRQGEAQALIELARHHRQRNAFEPALECARQALEIASALKSALDRARAHSVLGGVHRQRGALDEALEHLLAGVQTFEELECPHELANTYYELGELLLAQGRKEEALDYFQRSACILRRVGTGQAAGPPEELKHTRLNSLNPVT